jgi:capsular polysaccharide biosynthesis protein
VDLSQLLGLLRRRIRTIVATTLLGALGAAAGSLVLPATYEARASLIAPSLASTYAEVGESRPVLEHVIASLGLDISAEDLDRDVDAIPSQTSTLLVVSARHRTAAGAAAIANAVAAQIVELAPDIAGTSAAVVEGMEDDLSTIERELTRVEAAIELLAGRTDLTTEEAQALEAYRSQLVSLLSLRVSLQDALAAYAQSVVTTLAPAVAPSRPASPNVVLGFISGAFLGLVIGLVIVMLSIVRQPQA